MRVLVVEDERLLADAIAEGLRRRSMAVDVAYDGGAAVENAGPPVPPYEVPALFEPFRRLPTTERLADPLGGGAGLGLSIVRSVARAHGGDVHASSRPDGGLAVRVRLPAAGRFTPDS